MISSFIVFTAGFFAGNFVMVKYPTMYSAIISKGKEWYERAKAYVIK